MPGDLLADLLEGDLDKFAHAMRFAGCENVVASLRLLEYSPHAFDIVARMTPVAFGVEVAEIEPLGAAVMNRGDSARDFSRHESLAACRSFMVKEDAVGSVKPVCFSIVHSDPVGIELRYSIG